MPTTNLFNDLQRDEAHLGQPRLIAYPDPKSGHEPWTIGFGHTGPEVHPGLVWTADQCEEALTDDIAKFECGLDTSLPWWRDQSPLRQDCLLNMAFNMGVAKLLMFTTFLGLMKLENYPHAALDLRGTPWFHQVGDRAERIVTQILTDVHQD